MKKPKPPRTFHGKPCPKGHTLRYISSRRCAVCWAEPGRVYHQETEGRLLKQLAAIQRRYGLTMEQFFTLYDGQDRTCPICCEGLMLDEVQVDHDHSTGDVRGILCGHCNKALGLLKDSPEALRRAIAYLEKPRDP